MYVYDEQTPKHENIILNNYYNNTLHITTYFSYRLHKHYFDRLILYRCISRHVIILRNIFIPQMKCSVHATYNI